MQKNKRWFWMMLIVLFSAISINSQVAKEKAGFRIVGYYPLESAMTDSVDSVPFDLLTHINLWFLNPDSTGSFTQNFALLAPFITAAHANNVPVLVSIGGGSSHPYYHSLLQKENRAVFIARLVDVVQRNQIDGIDVDLEGPDIGEDYEAFVTELAAALRPQKKLLTAAIAVYYKDALTDKALAQYDFVNVMSYDRTGPWRPQKPGPHATFAHAAEDLAYFGEERKIAKEKMVLGVPFYGYGFDTSGTAPAVSMNYRQIVTQFPGAELADQWTMPDGKILYYNGLLTIRQKTRLAKEKASGIMIWQLKGDAEGQFSLLRAIHEEK